MGARRKKNRTHLKGGDRGEDDDSAPKSFVIKSGSVTKSVSQLVRDVRQVMEPNTATRLRERPNARLRDYLTIAPTLGVTHLLAFTLTEAANVHLRMARMPQGPTLTFRVNRYSLMKDLVNSSLKNIGKAPGTEYRNPPLLVLNNFTQQPGAKPLPQLKLMSTMFQGLFPAISVERSALPSFRRVLLISYNPTTNLISIRHYTITVRAHGVSRRVRKLLTSSSVSARIPNLSSKDDIADYLLRRVGTPGSETTETTASTSGYESAGDTDGSEAESDTNAVELPDDYGRGNKKGDRKAVRLVEIGPRMELRLIKVVEGLVGSKKGEGETVFHEFEQKSKTQANDMKRKHDERRALKDARRAEQAANVARKKAEKEKASKKAGGGDDDDDDDEEEEEGDDVDLSGLSDVDVDPDEVLQRRREIKAAKAAGGDQGDEEEDEDDEFAYEDAGMEDEDDDDEGDWDADVGAGEVSEEEEEESEDEAPPRPAKKK
ncbi:Brix domain-containing protein, partial [Dioszegia hungarica]